MKLKLLKGLISPIEAKELNDGTIGDPPLLNIHNSL